jgi:oxygen-independent coproporphyrinogen-3 oxidase
MGLRVTQGVNMSRFSQLTDEFYTSRINELIDIGVIETDGEILRLTAKGRPVLNAVLRTLLGA